MRRKIWETAKFTDDQKKLISENWGRVQKFANYATAVDEEQDFFFDRLFLAAVKYEASRNVPFDHYLNCHLRAARFDLKKAKKKRRVLARIEEYTEPHFVETHDEFETVLGYCKSPDGRDILRQLFVEGMTSREVGKGLNVTYETVRLRKQKCFAEIRDGMAPPRSFAAD